jgi:hypothetical protein
MITSNRRESINRAQKKYLASTKGRSAVKRYAQSPRGKRLRRTANRKSWLKCAYNLTPELYDAMFKKQHGQCAICHQPERHKDWPLSVDHCHKSGRIRGLVCDRCNTGLGRFNDNPKLLLRAVAYLTQ